jgi:hypothetical protein
MHTSIRFIGLALAFFSAQALACDTSPTIASTDDFGVASTSSGANWGYYEWSEGAQTWVRAEQGLQSFVEHEAFESGDIALSGGQFPRAGSSPSPDPRPPTHPESVSCEPVDMPTVTATAPRPSGGSGFMMIYRPSVYARNTGGGGFSRARNAVGVKQADKNLTCASGDEALRAAARFAIKYKSPVPRAGVYLVRYASGHYQLWAVMNPMFSDLGLAPVAECVSKTG